MAPKKSIPSKNPISHCGSSYSSSLPSRDRFRDSKSQNDFKEDFCDRAIHSKRMVFCLTFQTLLYLMRLALEIGNLFTRNPLDVPACLYMSSTPTLYRYLYSFVYYGILRNSYCSYTRSHFRYTTCS